MGTKIIKQKFVYQVPNSLLVEDYEKLEVHIKILESKNYKERIEKINNIIKGYIGEAKHTSNINGLYNKLFDEIDEIFTFKARYKELLAGNNIHIQIIL